MSSVIKEMGEADPRTVVVLGITYLGLEHRVLTPVSGVCLYQKECWGLVRVLKANCFVISRRLSSSVSRPNFSRFLEWL